MKIEASAGRYAKGKPGLREHCERLVIRATCDGEPQLLAALYRGLALNQWNEFRDFLDEAAPAAGGE